MDHINIFSRGIFKKRFFKILKKNPSKTLFFRKLNQNLDQKYNSYWDDQLNREAFHKKLLKKLCLLSPSDEVSERGYDCSIKILDG